MRLSILMVLLTLLTPQEATRDTEVVYAVDEQNPPPNTFTRAGAEGEGLVAIGKEVELSKAMETILYFKKEKTASIAKPEVLFAHFALHNPSRLESVKKVWPDRDIDLSKLNLQKMVLQVADVKEEEREGAKVLRIEVTVAINISGKQVGRARQSAREVWEFDGKKLKLRESGKGWSFLFL